MAKIRTSSLFLLFFCVSFSVAFGNPTEKYISQGNQKVQDGRYDEAVKEYERALEIDPENARIHLLLGLTYAQLNKWEEALRYSKKATQLSQSYSTYYQLGLIYAATNAPDKALHSFDQALKLSPESYEAEYQKGMIFLNQKSYDQAIQSYERVIQLNPHYYDAYIGRGGAYYLKGDPTSALSQVAELREMKADSLADALEKWIQEKQGKGDYTAASEEPAEKR